LSIFVSKAVAQAKPRPGQAVIKGLGLA